MADLEKGFTLIELVIALVIISLIAMIAMPNYFEMRERGRQAMVVENMKIVQLAIEAFATDFDGWLPLGVDNPLPGGGFAYYFPGGDEECQTFPGIYPKNPYSGQHMIASGFLSMTYRNSGENRNEAIGGPNDLFVGRGCIRYGLFPMPAPPQVLASEYGIVGGGDDDKSIRIGGRIVVFHN